MIRLQLLMFCLMFGSAAYSVGPLYKLTANAAVTDIVIEGNMLYASTSGATINVFDIKQRKRVKIHVLPSIPDFMGDLIHPKIYDIDKLVGKDVLVAAVQGTHAYSNVYLISNGVYKQIIKDSKHKFMIKSAKFIDGNTLLFATLSNELILFKIKEATVVYRNQIAPYTFANMVLNEQRTEVITSDESGVIRTFNVKTGKELRAYSGENVDKVYQVDYKSSVVIGGGQDRRLSIYFKNKDRSYYIESEFLIYSVGLSPEANIGAYSANEENDIVVFNTNTKKQLAVLKGSETVINNIVFISENELFSSSDDVDILFWKI